MLDQQDSACLLSPPTQHDPLLTEYNAFLLQTCGFSEQTRLYRARNARQFLDRHFGDAPPVLDRLRPSTRWTISTATPVDEFDLLPFSPSLRSFFRFLALSHGSIRHRVVPAAPQWPMDCSTPGRLQTMTYDLSSTILIPAPQPVAETWRCCSA